VTNMTEPVRYSIRGLEEHTHELEQEVESVEPVMPPGTAVTLTPEQSAGWNDWCNELIDRQVVSAIKVLTREFAQADVDIRREYRGKLDAVTAELAAMREQLVQARLDVSYLRGVVDRDRGGGEIIDLPALPSKRVKLNG
jgi:hypothetical protein